MENIKSILVILVWISCILFVAIVCKKYFPGQKELSRKIIHIGTGPVIPIAWILEIPSNLAIPCAGIITIALLVNHRLRFISALEDVNRQSYGTIAYAFSITLLLIFLWPDNASSVSAGILSMSFGDGLAGLVGQNIKSPQWVILGQRKSLAGTSMKSFSFTIVLRFSGFSI